MIGERGFSSVPIQLAGIHMEIGYSSLGYLKMLPAQEVKIDRSFIPSCGTDAGDLAIVDVTIRLGHGLGLEIVAEGIETAQVGRTVCDLGADFGQGVLLQPVDCAPSAR